MTSAILSSAIVTRASDILAAAGARIVPMVDVTYCLVAPFTRDDEGQPVPGVTNEAMHGEAARRRAAAVATAAVKVGAAAFSRMGDPDSGAF